MMVIVKQGSEQDTTPTRDAARHPDRARGSPALLWPFVPLPSVCIQCMQVTGNVEAKLAAEIIDDSQFHTH
jgi:hypothetical protein